MSSNWNQRVPSVKKSHTLSMNAILGQFYGALKKARVFSAAVGFLCFQVHHAEGAWLLQLWKLTTLVWSHRCVRKKTPAFQPNSLSQFLASWSWNHRGQSLLHIHSFTYTYPKGKTLKDMFVLIFSTFITHIAREWSRYVATFIWRQKWNNFSDLLLDLLLYWVIKWKYCFQANF